MDLTDFSFANTGVPILIVAIATLLLPVALVSRQTRSHRHVTVRIMVTAVAMMVLSALVLWAFDDRDADAFANAVGDWRAVRYYLRASAGFALVWVPLLALVWFGQAQRVERMRGKDGMRDAD